MVAYPFSLDLPDPGIEPGSPALQADSLPAELPGKPEREWNNASRSNVDGPRDYQTKRSKSEGERQNTIVVIQSLSHVWLSVTPQTAVHQASLSSTICQSLLKFMSTESMMLCNHLILCCPLLLLPSIFPSIRVFSNESALCIRWPKYWNFSFTNSPSNEYSRFISFRIEVIHLQSKELPASESFPMSQLFTWGGQSTGVSASALFLAMNIQGWYPLGLTDLIPLLSKRLSKVYTMEYYSAIKKNTFESVLMRWMKLEPIIQSEVSQKEKHQYSILTHIYGI